MGLSLFWLEQIAVVGPVFSLATPTISSSLKDEKLPWFFPEVASNLAKRIDNDPPNSVQPKIGYSAVMCLN